MYHLDGHDIIMSCAQCHECRFDIVHWAWGSTSAGSTHSQPHAYQAAAAIPGPAPAALALHRPSLGVGPVLPAALGAFAHNPASALEQSVLAP